MPLLDAFKLDNFKIDGASGLRVKSIQAGSITISSGSTNTTTVNAVDLNKAILFWNGGTGASIPIVELTNATTITATRRSYSGTSLVNYVLVELEGIKEIRMGTFEYSDSPSTLTINAVDLDKTILIANGKAGGGKDDDDESNSYRIELTDATTITGYKVQSTATFKVGYILLTFK